MNITATMTTEQPSNLDKVIGEIYFYCTFSMSILSMIGSAFIVIYYLWIDNNETKTSNGRKILIYLSIADFLTAFGNIMGITWYQVKENLQELGYNVMCKFHASLTIFSSSASYFWTVSMTVYLYVCIVLRKQQSGDKLMIAFHLFCWIVPGK